MILVLGCIGLVILVGLVVGLIYILQSSQRDAVSSAREDWISAGNDKDDKNNDSGRIP